MLPAETLGRRNRREGTVTTQYAGVADVREAIGSLVAAVTCWSPICVHQSIDLYRPELHARDPDSRTGKVSGSRFAIRECSRESGRRMSSHLRLTRRLSMNEGKRKAGRPQKWSSDAERMRAARAAKRENQLAEEERRAARLKARSEKANCRSDCVRARAVGRRLRRSRKRPRSGGRPCGVPSDDPQAADDHRHDGRRLQRLGNGPVDVEAAL